jgi:IMP dehydrogenase/GMP reductase
MFLFFSVARSQENGSWERAAETAQTTPAAAAGTAAAKPAAAKVVPKNGTNPNFGMNMPMMSSAFDTAAWLSAA